MAHNADKVPKWLKIELFEDLLREILPNFECTKELKAEPGLGPGENYATIMLRIQLRVQLKDGTTPTLSFMMKVAHDSEKFEEFMKEQNIFKVERNVFENIVPELEQLYRDVGMCVKFGAKSYTIDTPANYVLLEDLRPRGFKNANRLEGLDSTHTECVLNKLAQWHAASAVRVEQKGAYDKQLTVGFFSEQTKDMLAGVYNEMGKYFIESAASYNGHEAYIEQVKALQSKIGDEIFKMGQVQANEFNVLNHGDCWSNNIMFQYDAGGNISETYFVDYQMPKYGTCAQDLLYFLLSSTRLEDKLSKFDYYVRYYHEQLKANLLRLKYAKPLPTLREIHAALHKYGIWGYSTVIGVMGAVLLEPTETAHFDNFLSDTAEGIQFKRLMYTNSRYRKHAEALLPWLLNRGALE